MDEIGEILGNENDYQGSSSVENILNQSNEINAPHPGMLVDRKQFRRAGPYVIGTEVIGYRPVRSIVQFIGKKQNTNMFYQLKILQFPQHSDHSSQEEQRGKMLLHTEYSLLSLLKNEPGIIKHHGMFSDLAFEETLAKKRTPTYTGAVMKRLILVLDCLIQHPFCDKSASYISLQEHMNVKKLNENEALSMFYEIVQIVENVHKKNVIHRDLKLGNIVLNKSSKQVIITNFCLGRYIPENTLLHDQVGSPAYISPEVISGNPYKGKPSDMWALGVIYFIMLFRNFPFFKSTSSALFAQIQSCSFDIPQETTISRNSIDVIKRLLNKDPDKRLTASQLRVRLESMLAMKKVLSPDQCVPYDESKIRFVINFKITPKHIINDQVVPSSDPNDEQMVPKPSLSTSYSCILQTLRENMLNTSKSRGTKRSFEETRRSGIINSGLLLHTLDNVLNGGIRTTIDIRNHLRNNELRNSSGTERMAQDFIIALDHYFASERILPPNENPLEEFNGILSDVVALRILRWITTEFRDEAIVQNFVIESDASIVSKVKTLLICCGVQVESTVFGPRILSRQPNRVLRILTYMLKIAGYDNTYFLTQLDASSS